MNNPKTSSKIMQIDLLFLPIFSNKKVLGSEVERSMERKQLMNEKQEDNDRLTRRKGTKPTGPDSGFLYRSEKYIFQEISNKPDGFNQVQYENSDILRRTPINKVKKEVHEINYS